MKTIIAVTAALIAVPAVAQPDATPRAPTIAAPASSGGPIKAKKKETRYCVMTEHVASRIQRRECRTRSHWLSYGYDPLDDLNK